MPPEPNSKIENLLKAWARKRRSQFGSFELQPLARRLLQDEVARRHRVQKPASSPSLWSALWVRLALGCAAAAMIVGIVLWHGRPATMELAQLSDQTKAPVESNKALQPDRKKEAESLSTRRDTQELAARRNAVDSPVPLNSPAAAAAPAPRPMAAAPPVSTAAPAVSSAPGNSEVPQVALQKEKRPAAIAQQPEWQFAFQKTGTSDKDTRLYAVAPQADVLSAFTVQRDGQKVRVIDTDGSIYEGQLVGLSTNQLAQGNRAADPSGAAFKSDSLTLPPAGFAFRVSGINKRLNQPVVFTGSISSPVSDLGRIKPNSGFGGGAQSSLAVSGALRSEASPNAQLNGRVKIANATEIPIHAQSR